MKRFLAKIYYKLINFFKKIAAAFFWIIYILFCKKPHVMTKEETIQKIINEKVSISRYGDGEVRLMINKGCINFQSYSDTISKKILDAFNTRNPKLLVCFTEIPNKIMHLSKNEKYYKRFIFYSYRKMKKNYDYNYNYGNASITRFYHPNNFINTDFEQINKYVMTLKKIWENRNLLIVEGEHSKLGIGNDLFDNAKSIRRILCPDNNCFDLYNDIYQSIIKVINSDDLLILALGPTASILSTELTINENIQCLDLGHIDMVYMWYLNKCDKTDVIEGKNCAESYSGKAISYDYNQNKYLKEVVLSIKP